MLEDLIVLAVPLAIPILLVASWLYNHKTPSGDSGSGGASASTKSTEETKKPDKLSDDQMTSG